MSKKIAVFCGSGFGNSPVYTEAAQQLAQWIAKKGYGLVFGGGDEGLMGITGKTVYDAGNEVLGVLPGNVRFIAERKQPYCTEVIVAKDLQDRKRIMMQKADVMIALPGGTGTLDEIAEAVTLTKIGTYHKPCIFFNKNGFYAPLKQMLEDMEKAGFAAPGSLSHVLFSEDPEEIEQFIQKF